MLHEVKHLRRDPAQRRDYSLIKARGPTICWSSSLEQAALLETLSQIGR